MVQHLRNIPTRATEAAISKDVWMLGMDAGLLAGGAGPAAGAD